MTERVEKIEVEKRIFVANDGAEFQTAQDCMQYERDCIERNARAIVSRLPHFLFSPAWIDPDYWWDWYFVSNDMERPPSGRPSSMRIPAPMSTPRRHTHAGSPVPLTEAGTEPSRERWNRCLTLWMSSRRALSIWQCRMEAPSIEDPVMRRRDAIVGPAPDGL